jgi:hypothetical protein
MISGVSLKEYSQIDQSTKGSLMYDCMIAGGGPAKMAMAQTIGHVFNTQSLIRSKLLE